MVGSMDNTPGATARPGRPDAEPGVLGRTPALTRVQGLLALHTSSPTRSAVPYPRLFCLTDTHIARMHARGLAMGCPSEERSLVSQGPS